MKAIIKIVLGLAIVFGFASCTNEDSDYIYTMVVDIHYSSSHIVRKTLTSYCEISTDCYRGTNCVRWKPIGDRTYSAIKTTVPIEVVSYIKRENKIKQ